MEIASHVRDVTVYREGAEVTRVAEVRPDDQGGYPEVVFLTGLPLALEDDSLRARVVGGLLATDLRVELAVHTEEQAPVPAEVTEELQRTYGEELQLQMQVDFKRGLLERMAKLEPARPDNERRVPLATRRQLVEFRQREVVRLQGEFRQVEDELRELQTRRRLLQARPPAPPTRLSKRVAVRLQAPEGASGEAQLELTYRTPGARWAPAYAFRLDRDLTMADVLMRVVVSQATGEDWKRVRLSVSTADPLSWTDLPELPAWRLGRRQAEPRKAGWRPPPPGTQALFADYDRARQGAPVEAVIVTPPSPPPVPEPEPMWEDPFVHPPAAQVDPFAAADPFGAPADPFGDMVCAFGAPSADAFAAAPADPFGAPAADPFGAPAADPFAAPAPSRQAMMSPKPSLKQRIAAVNQKPTMGGRRGSPPASAARPAYLGSAQWQSAPAELELGRELMSYGTLRMPAPDSPNRGRLQPEDVVEAALQSLRRRGLATSLDLRDALLEAQRRAYQVRNLSLRDGHRAPQRVQGFDYLYPGDGLVDLPADGQFHSLPLLVRNLPARAEYICVPSVTADVFRVVDLESLPDLALPAGPADVYVGDDFLIGTDLPDTGPGGHIRLGLGVEQQIKVARNTAYKETTVGMMGGTSQLRHTITVDLNNRLDHEVRVEIQERLPAPAAGQDDIKVKVEEATPAWEPFPQGQRWTVKVPGRERQTLKATYVIEIPSKLELQGGNRREA